MLALAMRRADREEVAAATGQSPVEALLESLDASEVAYTAIFDGEVAGMWGVVPIRETLLSAPLAGVAWFLSGGVVDRYPVTFARMSRRIVEGLNRRYPVLHNVVDCRYETALRWLSWLGFEIHEPIPYGHAGLPFCPVSRRSGQWNP